jgi:hypothetical protein
MSDYIPEFKVGDLVIKAGERIAELEEQLAAAQTENERLKKSVVWDVVNALACADEYKCELAAAQAEIARLREGRKIHNCEAAEAQISALEKDAAMLDWLADHEAVKNINRVNLSIYETAMCIAYERDVDAEPTVEDYRLALRLMIRTAINAEAAEAARGNDD